MGAADRRLGAEFWYQSYLLDPPVVLGSYCFTGHAPGEGVPLVDFSFLDCRMEQILAFP